MEDLAPMGVEAEMMRVEENMARMRAAAAAERKDAVKANECLRVAMETTRVAAKATMVSLESATPLVEGHDKEELVALTKQGRFLRRGERQPKEAVPIQLPLPGQFEMLYQRTPLSQEEWNKKKKKGQVAAQPPAPAIDARQEEQMPVVIKPSKPAFVDKGMAAFLARRKKEMETEPEESRTDFKAYEARLYRNFWNKMYAGEMCGSYEDITSIPPMCFTDAASTFAGMQPTMQVFSVKIEEVTGGLRWPLDVYGVVAVRDVVDHNRNVIFHRERDSCQTINSTDPYLALTGPTRAVVVSVDPTYFEVDLKVKGAIESEDKDLSLLAVGYVSSGPYRSFATSRIATSKISTLNITFGHIVQSVEATISVEVLGGVWPSVYHKGIFTAKTASIDDMSISLLAFGDGTLPVDNGKVKLSRRVVSVELVPPEEVKLKAKLKVCVKALHVSDKNGKVEYHLSFKPKSRGRSHRTIKIASCEMKVTVAWSLLSTFLCDYEEAMSAEVVPALDSC